MGDWVLTDSINAQMAARNSSAQVTVVVILYFVIRMVQESPGEWYL